MHRRALRHGLVVLLFVTAAGAAAFAWSVDRQLATIATAEHGADSRFDTLVQSIARFDATQQLFDPAREPEADWFARVRRLLAEIESQATGLRTSAASASAARTFDDITGRVVAAVAKAEENLRDGHDLMAADLVQDEAKPGAEAMRAAALEWRAADGNATETARATLVEQLWMVLGGTAAFWAIGVLLLAPRQAARAPATSASLSILGEPAGDAAIAAPAENVPAHAAAIGATSSTPARSAGNQTLSSSEAEPAGSVRGGALLDLVPAAELCADIARADSGETLAALVDRAADVIGAAGIVVWLAGGEEELIPALAHGYGPDAQGLLGALPLSEENVTTRAWHSGQLQWVDGNTRSRAALAAPMFQGPRRTGVLAVELANGAAPGPLPRALTSILAAQFATALTPQAAPATPSEPLEATGS
ncbi:MAG TPA: GAF domain-containing protein [Vicinamibacterales bacterium]|jgi:hypothetical protein|nr:GAF domain-containing protein [Vicinamibacterales bacterium]